METWWVISLQQTQELPREMGWVQMNSPFNWHNFWKKNTKTTLTHIEYKVSVFGFFLIRVFLHLKKYDPNVGKCGQENLRIWTIFTQCQGPSLYHKLSHRTLVIQQKHQIWISTWSTPMILQKLNLPKRLANEAQ